MNTKNKISMAQAAATTRLQLEAIPESEFLSTGGMNDFPMYWADVLLGLSSEAMDTLQMEGINEAE